MEIGKDETKLTPPEAQFIQHACAYHDDEITRTIKTKIRMGLLDWALTVHEQSTLDTYQGKEIGGAFLVGLAIGRWQPQDGEPVTVNLNAAELHHARLLAATMTEVSVESAKNMDSEYEDIDRRFPLPDIYMTEEEIESYKTSEFEERLREIQIGHTIIATIDASFLG